MEVISANICQEVNTYKIISDEVHMRSYITTMKQVFIFSILHNIKPKSHTSYSTFDTYHLLWCIVARKGLDVARLISNKIDCYM